MGPGRGVDRDAAAVRDAPAGAAARYRPDRDLRRRRGDAHRGVRQVPPRRRPGRARRGWPRDAVLVDRRRRPLRPVPVSPVLARSRPISSHLTPAPSHSRPISLPPPPPSPPRPISLPPWPRPPRPVPPELTPTLATPARAHSPRPSPSPHQPPGFSVDPLT